MRRTLFLSLPLTLLLAAPTLAAGLPAAISGLSFSPDGGKVLVSMDTDGVPNAYALPVAGGPPVQLTRSPKDPVWALSYFPADERILYRSGPAGDEDHLFVRELDGKAVELAPGKTSRFAGWAGDGALWIEIDNPGAQSRDLYKVAAAGYARTLVHRNSSALARLAAVSPDGRFLAFVESSNDLIRGLRIRDLQAGREKTQMAGEGFTVYIPLSFSPDGTGLLTLTDIDKEFSTHEFRALNRVDPATGKGRDLLQKSWDVLDALYSPDGKRIAVIAGGDTRSSLELYDAETLRPVALPGLPPVGDVTRAVFSRDGRRLAFLASGSATPPAVWVYDLAEPGPPSRLGAAPDGGWIEGEVKRFKSFDGQEIAGVLYKPREAAPDHKAPAVVWIHDGPSGQSRLEFDPLFQTLVQRGYAVYAVNERGSFGYGRTFQQLDDRRHGMQDLKDCVAAKAMLIATGWVDPGRVAVGGVGFGGFLTLTALASSPREFAAGVDLFGVSNWPRVLDTLPFHSSERLVLADEMGHVADANARELMAPHDRAGDIVRPLLLVQGARDTLAIPSEAADIAAALKKKGQVVEEIVLPDAAHGLVLRADRERVYKAVGDFLERNLKAAPAK
jgi:dipeptidyl aminopeptidase/acylaminoacyl peptidase